MFRIEIQHNFSTQVIKLNKKADIKQSCYKHEEYRLSLKCNYTYNKVPNFMSLKCNYSAVLSSQSTSRILVPV